MHLGQLSSQAATPLWKVVVARDGDSLRTQVDAENFDPSRTGGIALQEALVGQRLKVLGDSLGALYTKPLTDFTNGGLIRVAPKVMHHEVENFPLDFGDALLHPGLQRFALYQAFKKILPSYRINTCSQH